jgi:prephenate dehydrogenase
MPRDCPSDVPMKETAGIIGLGRFGKLLYEIIESDFVLKAYDVDEAAHAGFVKRAPLREVANSHLVFLCVPINHLETVLLEIKDDLRETVAVIDVCSVKLEPALLMERILPLQVDILPTHPIFGPSSAAAGIRGLPFVLCPTSRTSPSILSFTSEYLKRLGFRVLQMTCDEHDRITAYSLCVTQLLGRILGKLNLGPSPSDTQAFRDLLGIRDIALNDTLELFLNLQTKNPYAKEMREAFGTALDQIEQEINKWC